MADGVGGGGTVTWEAHLTGRALPTGADLDALEAAHGLRLPADHRALVVRYAGWAPMPCVMPVGRSRTPFGPLLTFARGPDPANGWTDTMDWGARAVRETGFDAPALPVLPVATNTAHGLFAFDYRATRGRDAPLVFLDLDHEPEDPGAVIPVAPSLTAALALLRD